MIGIDGWITIGTKLDTKKFDQEISNIENKIESTEKKQEIINQKTTKYQTELQKASYEVNSLSQEYEKAAEKAEMLRQTMNSTKPGSFQNFQATSGYEAQVKVVDELDAKLEKATSKQTELTSKVAQSKLQYESSAKAIDKLRGKLQQINVKRQQAEFKAIEGSTREVQKNIGNTIKKIGKMALAVFSVRSAYSALSRASATLSQYNEQYATDLEYMRFALAQGVAPILEKIVNLAQTLIYYINYLSQAWFGINLFSNASAKSFQEMSKNAGKTAKSTKEMKNNLASFDELNVLSQNNEAEAGGVGSVAPSFDLGSMEEIKIPEWLVKIADILKPVVDFFNEIKERYGPVATGIAIVVSALAGFGILKGIISLFTGLGKIVGGISVDFTGFFNALGRAAEAIAILGGLTLVINSITDLIKTFSESGMTLGEVAGLLGIVLGELAVTFIVLMGVMTALIPSWQSIAGAAVIFGGLAVVLLSVSNLIKTFSESGTTLNNVIGLMSTVLLTIVGTMGMVALLGPAMTAGLVPFLATVGGISAILTVMALTLPTILDAVDKFINGVAPSLITIIDSISKGIAIIIEAIGTTLPPIIQSIGEVFTSIFNGVANIIKTVGDTIIRLQESTLDFINKLGPAINTFVDGIISAVTKLINFIISGIEYMVNLVIEGINKIIEAVNSVGDYVGITIPRVSTFELPKFVPKLAKGGIINQPTHAIIGEAGREAVLPLENNTEWMDILADKIAGNIGVGGGDITINFTGSMAQFVRMLKPQIDKENSRVGARIITGGAY